MKTQPETTEAPQKSPQKPETAIRVRVLKNGIPIAGGVAAKGAALSVPVSEAEFREKRGEVQIL